LGLNSYLGTTTVKKVPDDQTVDYLTGELRRKTPEELVRQRVLQSLIEEYAYKKNDIELEFRIKMGSERKPVDIGIFQEGKPHTQENLYLIVETKKQKIKPADRNEGIDQLKSYTSACANCQFGLWTNGIDRFAYQKTALQDGTYSLDEIIDVPIRGKSLDEYEKLSFEELRPALDLKSVFQRCHDYIYANQGLQKTEAFHELLKVIFCKIYDETGSTVRFYATSQERRTPVGQNRVKERLEDLFKEVKAYPTYQHIFKKQAEEIELEANVLAFIVSQLQYYTLLQTDTDVKGEAYEEIVGANLRGDRGEFFTPRNVCNMAVECVFNSYPKNKWDKLSVIDPACGTGGFLIAVIDFIKDYFFQRELAKWGNEDQARNTTTDLLKAYCGNYLYGIDINPLLVRATQMNEVMHGNGSGNLVSVNSLKPPTDWTEEVQGKVALGKYSILFTNPPFGSKIPIDDPRILGQYDLGHVWDNGSLEMKNKLATSVPPEELFIERCMQLLSPGGRMAIVLPDSILSNPGKKYIRYWLLKRAKVIASIDLPRETFQPNVGSKTSLLIVQKKNEAEIKLEELSGKASEYDIFMSLVSFIGHDRRGVEIYRRTPEGEIIFKEKIRNVIRLEGKTRMKDKVAALEPVVYDELPEVAASFKNWIQAK
jgi:type I restriction enzyme M protein